MAHACIVIDGFAPPELCMAAEVEWPRPDWPHWHRYEGEQQGKLASKDAHRLPPACQELVRMMMQLRVSEQIGISGTFPDSHLYGAGMHEMQPGSDLPRHLDGDHHPVTGHERALSGVLFVSSHWEPHWGGELQLWDGDRIAHSIEPRCGRLAVFACSDTSWHSVARVHSLAPESRKTLAVFWWRLPRGEKKRSKALFA